MAANNGGQRDDGCRVTEAMLDALADRLDMLEAEGPADLAQTPLLEGDRAARRGRRHAAAAPRRSLRWAPPLAIGSLAACLALAWVGFALPVSHDGEGLPTQVAASSSQAQQSTPALSPQVVLSWAERGEADGEVTCDLTLGFSMADEGAVSVKEVSLGAAAAEGVRVSDSGGEGSLDGDHVSLALQMDVGVLEDLEEEECGLSRSAAQAALVLSSVQAMEVVLSPEGGEGGIYRLDVAPGGALSSFVELAERFATEMPRELLVPLVEVS